ncbi:MAG: helix-turn-helix domain-containing protein [Methanothrix sp.]|nr:helix-turn-helix domain-containing protein [Methanothrix sp.]
MIIGYKYPIFPDKISPWKLAENLDACRWLYNQLLQDLSAAKERGIKLKTYFSWGNASHARQLATAGAPPFFD